MAASCPEPSNLPQFCVGGQLSPISCDLNSAPDIRVILRLVDSAGNLATGVTDPSTCAEFMAVTNEEIHVGSQGCWCICIPFANYSSVDPLNAANPANTFWEIRLFTGDASEGNWSLQGTPRTFQIDADFDYAAGCGTCAPYGVSCGSCIPLSCLLNPTGTLPSTVDNAWCGLVENCMAATIANLQTQIDALTDTDTFVTFTENPDGSISSTNADGSPGPTWPAPTVNTDTDTFVTFGTDADGNVTTVNADGSAGPTLCAAPCEDTNTTTTTVELAASDDGGSLEITLTDSDNNPVTGSIPCADLAAILTPCLPAGAVDTFVTFGTDADGNITVTNADGTAGPILCPAPCGTGGDPIVFNYVPYDATTHVAGPIAGAGTTASPYQIPLPSAADYLCDQLNAITESTDPIATTDKLLVLQGDDSCAVKSLCSETVSSGGTDFTGQRAGFFIMGCEAVPMPTEANPAGGTDWNPEIDYPAADFPIGWQQQFTDAFSGHETWMVQTQIDGTTHLWVQVTA